MILQTICTYFAMFESTSTWWLYLLFRLTVTKFPVTCVAIQTTPLIIDNATWWFSWFQGTFKYYTIWIYESSFAKDYSCHNIIPTQLGCLSSIVSYLMFNVCKSSRHCYLICCCRGWNYSSFVTDSHAMLCSIRDKIRHHVKYRSLH